jgi:hypothetical protein
MSSNRNPGAAGAATGARDGSGRQQITTTIAPPQAPEQFAQDRAAVVATAVIQLIFRSPTPRDLHAQIATLLRDEFADAARQALADTRHSDP